MVILLIIVAFLAGSVGRTSAQQVAASDLGRHYSLRPNIENCWFTARGGRGRCRPRLGAASCASDLADIIRCVPIKGKIFDSGVIEISPAVSDHSVTYTLVDFSYKQELSFNRKVFIYKRFCLC